MGVKREKMHHLSKHPLHCVWQSMISRCTYHGDTNYRFYGERGIRVCEEWKQDFIAFFKWAMQNGYTPGITLDRIDTNGDYSPANCRWIPLKEQFKNRRSNRWITVDGETKIQSDWAAELGINHSAISQARRRGNNVEDYIRKRLSVKRYTDVERRDRQ